MSATTGTGRRVGWLVGTAMIAGVVVVLGPSRPPTPTTGMPRDTSELPECRHSMGNYIDSSGTDTLLVPNSGRLSLPGPITNVVEFHDCQRFIQVSPSGIGYDSLFAIFGAWNLAARWDSISGRPVPPPRRRTDSIAITRLLTSDSSLAGPPRPVDVSRAVPTAAGPVAWGLVEIYAEGAYKPLGIRPGFNCAYFYLVGGELRAKMINYGHREQDCSLPVDPTALNGMVLEVRFANSVVPEGPGGKYPASARWDWDPKNLFQYFGVACGPHWCEVGPRGFVASTPQPKPGFAPQDWKARVFEVKGWFDEQQLAVPGTAAKPAPIRGRVFPDPALDELVKSDFEDRWMPAAWVSLDAPEVGYAKKLNLRPGASSTWEAMSRIELCWGKWTTCRGRWRFWVSTPRCGPDPYGPDELPEDRGTWWAKITSAGKIRYYCVRRRDHGTELTQPGYAIPMRGTVRWRWRAADETIWLRCDRGCCEIEA